MRALSAAAAKRVNQGSIKKTLCKGRNKKQLSASKTVKELQQAHQVDWNTKSDLEKAM